MEEDRIKAKLKEIIDSPSTDRTIKTESYASLCRKYKDEIFALKNVKGFTYKEIEQIFKDNDINIPWSSIRLFVHEEGKKNG